MVYILSKLLYVFILPLTWVFCLLLYALFAKNRGRKRKVLIFAIVMFWFFGNRFTVNLMASIWDIEPNQASAQQYSAAILLGGFVSEGKNGEGHFNAAAGRYSTAVKLLEQGTAKHLLFSGGNADINPDGFTEAGFVAQQMKKTGIADSLVLLDSKARNTMENAAFSKALLQKAGLKPPYLLVTSAYHMRRAMLIYKKAGLVVVPYPCDYITGYDAIMPTDLVPNADAFGKWNTYIKEMLGYIVALFN
ncbi:MULTISPECIES: YdcF family protein [unclassified Mucilaginibacter]|uniref:YdcF family protein n=1 Tax=unclassified Mucilaginibacter TaxID=2617802 RepID=UPI002AC98ABC|nr:MULTISPECIES: YdcF family protein [unclassified Mucilaginibacter]MEB0279869.1 YdcF family protein [Mucilaginibacter sp. 10B2]MEB0302452.1 YdcF family protein [Mucilaginibacter sp. 5C4]WPX24160.1 YdcF family protein [Mucilaginibacter sp. 5C4]